MFLKDHFLKRTLYLLPAIVFAIFYGYFLKGEAKGIAYAAYMLAFAASFVGLIKVIKEKYNQKALLLLIPIIVFAFSISYYNNLFAKAFLPLIINIFLVIFLVLFSVKGLTKENFAILKIPFFRNILLPFKYLKTIFIDLAAPFKTKYSDKSSDKLKKILLGALIAVPFIFVFLILFSSADAIFAKHLVDIVTFEIDKNSLDTFFFIVFMAMGLAMFLRMLISRENTVVEKDNTKLLIDSTIANTILTFINLVFIGFILIQLAYLFGGEQFVKANELNYADYARKGFFQISYIVAFSVLIVAGFYNLLDSKRAGLFSKVLLSILLFQVFIIAVSAFKRMNVYEGVYGLTFLRFYVDCFIYYLMGLIALSLFFINSKYNFRTYLYSGLTFSIIALTIVSSLNSDVLIAKRNVQNGIDGKVFDAFYFKHLSVDAAQIINEADLHKIQISDLKILKSIYVKKLYSLEQEQKGLSTKFSTSKNIEELNELIEKLDQQIK